MNSFKTHGFAWLITHIQMAKFADYITKVLPAVLGIKSLDVVLN
jgi:hypothetical protein